MGLGVKSAFQHYHAKEIHEVFPCSAHAISTSFCRDRGAVRKRLAERFSDGRIATCHPKSVRVFASSSNRTDGWIARSAPRGGSISRRSRSLGNYSLRASGSQRLTTYVYVKLSVMGVFLITLYTARLEASGSSNEPRNRPFRTQLHVF
jgi:hypothetical protein